VPDFLSQALSTDVTLDGFTVLVRLLFATLFGAVVAWTYKRTRDPGDIAATFPTTLVLLAILIAMVTQVIGDNVARAFSLVGALSIVRFRTVVRDTQDTAFVIFAVVVGMAAGANRFLVALFGLVIVGTTAYVMRSRRDLAGDAAPSFELVVRTGLGSEVESLIGQLLDEHLVSRRITASATARQGVALEVTYDTRHKAGTAPDALVRA
jgi:hypothetical protein